MISLIAGVTLFWLGPPAILAVSIFWSAVIAGVLISISVFLLFPKIPVLLIDGIAYPVSYLLSPVFGGLFPFGPKDVRDFLHEAFQNLLNTDQKNPDRQNGFLDARPYRDAVMHSKTYANLYIENEYRKRGMMGLYEASLLPAALRIAEAKETPDDIARLADIIDAASYAADYYTKTLPGDVKVVHIRRSSHPFNVRADKLVNQALDKRTLA